MPSEPTAVDTVLTSAGFLMLKAGAKFGAAIDEALATFAITGRQFLVLTFVAHDDRLSQLELSRRIGLDPTIVSGLLDALESGGALTRRRDPDDRRRHLIELTPQGRKMQAQAAAAVIATEAEFLSPLDPEARGDLRAMMLDVMRGRLAWLEE